ncbi:MAG: 50S ribosomal protein L18 [Candidatus Pacearchaeota archaeon]|nr:50S ribosomal protein L18 [Candidatus Pacearchaeota archaeon]
MKTLRRRRKENKTDYNIRIKLLKGGVPRVVFRKTNRYVLAEYVISEGAKDKVLMEITSKILLKYGWPEDRTGSLKSIPASYLTGFLFGKRINEKKMETPVLDIGMIRNVRKSRIFSFIKGLIDAGVKIQCKEEFFPGEGRIKGKDLKHDFSFVLEKVKSKIEKNE